MPESAGLHDGYKLLQTSANFSYNPRPLFRACGFLMENGNHNLDVCRVAIITAETSAFPDMEHFLAPRFTAVLTQDEKQIQTAVDDPEIRAVLLDLDSVGQDSAEALRLLRDIRHVRDDLVLVAITRSNSRS